MVAYVSGPAYLDMVREFTLAYPLKAMLLTSTFTFDPDLHHFRGDLTNEVSGLGYTEGGVEIVRPDALLVPTTNEVHLVGEDVPFGTLTVEDISWLVVYRSTGAASTDSIITAFSMASADYVASPFTFVWNQRSDDITLGVVGKYHY